MSTVGMNLSGIVYWNYQEPFLDRMKISTPWQTYGGSAASTAAPTDAHGNLTSVPAGVTGVTALVGVDPMNSGKTNIYEVTYSGTGTVSVGAGASTIASTPGHITVQASQATFQIFVTADSGTDPLHDFHVVRQDQVALFQTGELFNPDFLAKVSHWDTLRFMDWGATNDSTISSWAQRTTLGDTSWHGDKGVPIEAMVKLCNEAHTDMWFNIPTQADDTYVRNALQLIKDTLDPSLKVTVEYSNEVWNWGFAQSRYAQDKANQLWAHDSNGNGTIDSAEAVQGGNEVYYGYRSAQIAAIAHDVFGASAAGRLVDVLAGQAVNPDLTTYQAQGVALAHQGSIGSLFSQYAVTTYFGWQFGFAATAADQATIYQWATSGEAGKQAAFNELAHGGALSGNTSLDSLMQYYTADAAFAQANGLSLVAYEGGSDLEYAWFPSSQQATIKQFFADLTNDPRMGPLYTKMLQDFSNAGGITANVHADVGYSSPFGYFGVLDSIYQSGSARYDALVSYAAAHAHGSSNVGTLPSSGVSVPASGSTGASTPAVSVGGLITGTSGNDQLAGSNQSDTIDGAGGDDRIAGGSSGSADSAGRLESDVYMGGSGADTISGGGGNDHIYGNAVTAAAGSADGADSLMGMGGNDYIQGNAGSDMIDGGDGNDRLYGGGDNDVIRGSAGHDYLQGNKGSDTLSGGDGNDSLHGGADGDRLTGDAGSDQLFGDAGNDMIVGGAGNDLLIGGAGNDTFVFNGYDAGFSLKNAVIASDEVTDFVHGSDHFQFDFHPVQVLQGSAPSSIAAVIAANKLIGSHSGEQDVAAITVGDDTYLFWDSTGNNSSANCAIKVDHVGAGTLALADFV